MIYAIIQYELDGNLVRGCRRPILFGANICKHIFKCVVIPRFRQSVFSYLHCILINPDYVLVGGLSAIQQVFLHQRRTESLID